MADEINVIVAGVVGYSSVKGFSEKLNQSHVPRHPRTGKLRDLTDIGRTVATEDSRLLRSSRNVESGKSRRLA